jgi:hypothetical protein
MSGGLMNRIFNLLFTENNAVWEWSSIPKLVAELGPGFYINVQGYSLSIFTVKYLCTTGTNPFCPAGYDDCFPFKRHNVVRL